MKGNTIIYLLTLFTSSTHGRQIENVPDISINSINYDIKTESTKTYIDLPIIEKNGRTDDAPNTISDSDVLALPTEGPYTCNVTDITDNTIDSHIDITCVPHRVDNGTALILTPYLKENRFEEARNACRVNRELFLGFESYSGFLTVNEEYDSNLFFWYFPNPTKPVNETPWIIWLQGGPGASSMTGLFDEIGPFKVDSNYNLTPNMESWLQEHSLLFIDNPVGTGYSFTNHVDGFTKDMPTYGSHLYIAFKQFLQIFPELRSAPLFVAGESYAGKYVPALAMEIHTHKNTPEGEANLQGLILGNAYVDPGMILNMDRPFYYFGLLEREQTDLIKPLLDSFRADIAANRSTEAKDKWNRIITVLLLLTNQKHAYNFLRDDIAVGRYIKLLSRSDVKRALHVGDIKFGFVNMTVNQNLKEEFLTSAKPTYEALLEHYRVMAYCGQLDQMLSCVQTSENYRTWQWSGAQEFLNATRYPYMFRQSLAGYHKTGGRFTEVVLRGAGHMAPADVPAPAHHLVARWVRDEPLAEHTSSPNPEFIAEFIRNSTRTHEHYL